MEVGTFMLEVNMVYLKILAIVMLSWISNLLT